MASAVPSPSESARFGISVGRLDYTYVADWEGVDVVADLADSDVDLVILRFPAERLEVVRSVHESGRPSLMADTLLHFRREPIERADAHGMQLRPLTSADTALMDDLVADIFPEYRNHYESNPLTRGVNLVEAYQEWARTFLDAPDRRAFCVQIPEDGEAGLCMFEWSDTHLESILAGMRPRARGVGGYQDVLRCQANWGVDNGLTSMGVLTQVWNTSAMKPMIKVGLLPDYAISTMHVMR